MAKRKPEQKPPQLVNLQIKVDVKPDTPFHYINYIGIHNSPYDYTMSMIKIPAQFSDEQIELAKKGQLVPLEPVIQIVFPTQLIDGLIAALQKQKELFQQMTAPKVENADQDKQHVRTSTRLN
jgi:hypothetical protein